MLWDVLSTEAGTLKRRFGGFYRLPLFAKDGLDDSFFFDIFHILATNILGLRIILKRNAFWQQCQKQCKKQCKNLHLQKILQYLFPSDMWPQRKPISRPNHDA